jgi:hypothetical protein
MKEGAGAGISSTYRKGIGNFRNAVKMPILISEGNKSLGSPRNRWGDNIIVDLRELEWEG